MTEAMFSKRLIREFKAAGVFAQRIESPTTGAGIPDLLVTTGRGIKLVELKVKDMSIYHPKSFVPRGEVTINWSPSQTAFAKEIYEYSGHRERVVTFARFTDGVLLVIPSKFEKTVLLSGAIMYQWYKSEKHLATQWTFLWRII